MSAEVLETYHSWRDWIYHTPEEFGYCSASKEWKKQWNFNWFGFSHFYQGVVQCLTCLTNSYTNSACCIIDCVGLFLRASSWDDREGGAKVCVRDFSQNSHNGSWCCHVPTCAIARMSFHPWPEKWKMMIIHGKIARIHSFVNTDFGMGSLPHLK